jgi:hypothetical protein
VAVVRHDRRTWSRAAAWSLGGLTLLELAAVVVLLALNASRAGAARLFSDAILAVAIGLGAALGQLIIGRRPRNAVGWLLGLAGLSLAASMFTEQYALLGLAVVRTRPGPAVIQASLPAARLAGWAAGVLASVTVILLLFVLLLFPDGRLPSRRWRPVLWAMVVVAVSWTVGQFHGDSTVTGGITNALSNAGITYSSPVRILPWPSWLSGAGRLIFVLGVIAGVLVVASVFVRRRGASTERRKQLAWLGCVALMTAMWAAVAVVVELAAPGPANGWLGELIWTFLILTPVLGIPLACAVAILKYRLYEIDRIISRTLAYTTVTALLIGVYAGLVLLATHLLRFHSSVAVAVSTLAAAALFTPLRSRTQQVVDRRFNRTRYDADRTVTAFAARLKDAVDQDAVRADLLGVIQRSLEPTHATVWVRPMR